MACLRDWAGQATGKMVLEPISESGFQPFAWGFRPRRSPHHALSAWRRGPAEPTRGFTWLLTGEIAAWLDAIDHRLRRRVLKTRIQDQRRLDRITRLLHGSLWAEGRVR
jgi:RNA-directed DNA polymerase